MTWQQDVLTLAGVLLCVFAGQYGAILHYRRILRASEKQHTEELEKAAKATAKLTDGYEKQVTKWREQYRTACDRSDLWEAKYNAVSEDASRFRHLTEARAQATQSVQNTVGAVLGALSALRSH